MKNIEQLSIQFRKVIYCALLNGEFENDNICFSRFPHGCCGDASCLMENYLFDNEIETQYVCGEEEYPK